MLPTPFFHTDHNKSLEAQANIKVPGGFYFMGDKKKTGLYLMPSLKRQALFVSVNLFGLRRQSASQRWCPEHCRTSSGDNNRGAATFY